MDRDVGFAIRGSQLWKSPESSPSDQKLIVRQPYQPDPMAESKSQTPDRRVENVPREKDWNAAAQAGGEKSCSHEKRFVRGSAPRTASPRRGLQPHCGNCSPRSSFSKRNQRRSPSLNLVLAPNTCSTAARPGQPGTAALQLLRRLPSLVQCQFGALYRHNRWLPV